MIADEVICGFGRLGEWFGSEYFSIHADLMPIAKGMSSGYLPIGGLMVGDRVANTLIDKGGDFNHGFTYSGHPAACAVALENICILKKENIIDTVKNETSPYLQKRWLELGSHPLVGEARGVGMVGALELVKNKETKESFPEKQNVGTVCRDFCFNNGLVMRAVADTMIISPPLIISNDEIDELIAKARLCLNLTAEKIGINRSIFIACYKAVGQPAYIYCFSLHLKQHYSFLIRRHSQCKTKPDNKRGTVSARYFPGV